MANLLHIGGLFVSLREQSFGHELEHDEGIT